MCFGDKWSFPAVQRVWRGACSPLTHCVLCSWANSCEVLGLWAAPLICTSELCDSVGMEGLESDSKQGFNSMMLHFKIQWRNRADSFSRVYSVVRSVWAHLAICGLMLVLSMSWVPSTTEHRLWSSLQCVYSASSIELNAACDTQGYGGGKWYLLML